MATLRQWFWLGVARNRWALALASLAWLAWRSGPQPRRLAYPCQQAAAANLGVIAIVALPILARWRRLAVVTACLLLALGTGRTLYSVINAAATSSAILPPPRTLPVVPAQVGIVQDIGDPLSDTEIENMVRKAVADVGGLGGIIHAGQTVVIKPNLVQTLSPAGEGITTDPRVARAVVRLAQEAGAGRVVIAEGTASSRNGEFLGRGVTWKAFTDSGYDSNGDHYDDQTGVELYDLNDTGGLNQYSAAKVARITIPNGVFRTSYWVPKALLRPDQGGWCDVLITVPTLKNHGNGAVTGAMKNRVGCAPSDIYHADFAPYQNQMKWSLVHANSKFPRNVVDGGPYPVPPNTDVENAIVQYSIVDLNLVRPQDFAVIDGLVGITNGPVGQDGFVLKPNPFRKLVIAGADSVAVDTVATLAMGYNPRQVAHLAWGDNRGLGTLDTAQITVNGHHLAAVRLDFPDGYGGAVRVERTSPVLSASSLADGQVFGGPTTISGSASDNVGLAKAELSVTRITPNLLTNGGFEAGQTGWTKWNADWGTRQAADWNFASTQSGAYGKCLKLGRAESTGSFGAYQEVAVEAGKRYRVDAWWRGQKLGDMNWFEVLLIDGPFTMAQADNGGEPLVRAGYMYAYDNYTHGLPGPIGTVFGWLWSHDHDGTGVDYNSRHGVRTASGNTMAVVLKAGSTSPGIACWFDEVTLTEEVEEQVVATLPHPANSFDLLWDSRAVEPGDYLATLTVYDAALNEASVSREIQVVPTTSPILTVSPAAISHGVDFGQQLPSDTITVNNVGMGSMPFTISADQPWIQIDPAQGEVNGQPWPVAIDYTIGGLPPGVHQAVVSIEAPNAYEPLKTATVTITIQANRCDFDRDGDVDQDDFAHLQACLGPDGVASGSSCQDARLDGDTDVDTHDASDFMNCLSGPGRTPAADCLN